MLPANRLRPDQTPASRFLRNYPRPRSTNRRHFLPVTVGKREHGEAIPLYLHNTSSGFLPLLESNFQPDTASQTR